MVPGHGLTLCSARGDLLLLSRRGESRRVSLFHTFLPPLHSGSAPVFWGICVRKHASKPRLHLHDKPCWCPGGRAKERPGFTFVFQKFQKIQKRTRGPRPLFCVPYYYVICSTLKTLRIARPRILQTGTRQPARHHVFWKRATSADCAT